MPFGRQYRWVVLGAGTLAQSSFSAVPLGVPVLAPALRAQYHLSLAQIGVVLGAVTLGMLPTFWPWGLLADRIGERVVISIGLAAAGVAVAAIPLTHGFAALVGLLALSGALGASVNAASGRAVMHWFSAEERGLALGIRQTSVLIGGSVAALVLPLLVSDGSTRAAFLVLGAFCVVGAVVAVVLMREGPSGKSPGHAKTISPIRARRNWLIAVSSSMFVVAQVALTTYPVLFLHQHRGLTTHAAALVLAAINVLGICARIGLGRWSDRAQTRIGPLRTLGLLMTLGTAGVALLVDAPLPALVAMIIVAGVLTLSWNGIAFTAAAETAGIERSGAALGFQLTVIGVVVTVTPPAFATLVGATSWRATFAAVALCPLVGALALRLVPEAAASERTRGPVAIPPLVP